MIVLPVPAEASAPRFSRSTPHPLAWLAERARRFLAAHNPFFLLSALCMLFACFLLVASLDPRAGAGAGKIIVLVTAINLYEGMLIGLGGVLLRRPKAAGEGRTLLFLEALFLADATYLGAECIVAGLAAGAFIAAVLLALALVKVRLLARAAGTPLGAGPLTVLGLLYAALFFGPALLAAMQRAGSLSQTGLFGAWCLAGLLVIARALLPPEALEPGPPRARGLFGLILLLPFPALFLRLFAAGWDAGPFRPFFASPVLLGLGFWLLARGPGRAPRALFAAAALGLPAAGVALALDLPAELWSAFSGFGGRLFSPFRVTMGAAGLIYLFACFRHRLRLSLILAAPAFLLAAAGSRLLYAVDNIAAGFSAAGGEAGTLLPQTTFQVGLTAMAAAFAFLALGGAVSLHRSRAEEGPPGAAGGPPDPAPGADPPLAKTPSEGAA